MKNITNTILLASLIVAMILPFSGMMMAEAVPNENASDKAKDKAKEREKRTDPEPKKYKEIKDKKSKDKHEEKADRKLKPTPPKPALGEGHESFGTILNIDTSNISGVFSKNEIHDDLTLEDNTYLYAPTTLAPNYSGFEVVTYYADQGWFWGTDRHVILFDHSTQSYDWTNDFEINSAFIDTYTLTQGTSDFYFTEIIKSGNTWYAYIYNFDSTSWDLWDTVSSNGQIADGWVAWEEYYFDNDNCPTTLPEITSSLTQVYHNSSWKYATSSYASEFDSGSVCGITSASFTSNYYNWNVDD